MLEKYQGIICSAKKIDKVQQGKWSEKIDFESNGHEHLWITVKLVYYGIPMFSQTGEKKP